MNVDRGTTLFFGDGAIVFGFLIAALFGFTLILQLTRGPNWWFLIPTLLGLAVIYLGIQVMNGADRM